jgi:hypothetical protein
VRLTRSSHQIGGLIKSGLIKICRPEQSEGSGYLLATVMHVPGKDDFQAVMGGMEFKEGCSTYPCTSTAGQWLDTKNRYLGLQFVIKGQVHYGWARLTVIFRHNLRVGYWLLSPAMLTKPSPTNRSSPARPKGRMSSRSTLPRWELR